MRDLRAVHGVENDQDRYENHVRGESALKEGLPETFPDAHPGPRPEHGPHDQRRKTRESVEAGHEVAGGAQGTDEERDDQAGRDGCFGVQPEAKDQQRARQHRAADAYEARQSPRADPPEEREGEMGARRASNAFAVPPARPRRRVGEREKEAREHHLRERLREEGAHRYPDQGRRRDRQGEERRRPPVHGGLAPHAPQRSREGAEDDDDQASGDGLPDIPSRRVDQRRDEDGAPADAKEARENAAEQAREAQDQQLQEIQRYALELVSLGLGGASPAPAPEQKDGPRHERHRDRVVQVVQEMAYPVPVLSKHISKIRQGGDPGYTPEERVKGELGEVHPGGPGGGGDESADHGQAAGDEYREIAGPVEPFLGDVEVMSAYPDVAPVVQPQLPPTPEPDEVRDPRADQVPQHPGGDCREEAHLSPRDQVACKRRDGLGGDQDPHALEQHEHEDRGDAVISDGPRDEVYERLQDRFEHPEKLTPPYDDFQHPTISGPYASTPRPAGPEPRATPRRRPRR